MIATMGPAPGFKTHPNHRVALVRDTARVIIRFGGEVIADTADAITVHEGSYAPVYYLPRDAVRMTLLTRTDHHTHCPFKGDASYWTITAGGQSLENVAWSYEGVFDEAADLKDRIAVYQERVDSVEIEPR